MLCFAEHVAEGIETILKNASKEQIEASFERVWKLKEKAFQASSSSSNLENGDELNRELAKKSLTLVTGNDKNITDL